MVMSPRQLELAQPKTYSIPEFNDPINNLNQDSRKPVWRSTRELCNARGLPFRSGELPGTASNSYYEERFGWRSGYFTMWDTHPTGTKNSVDYASDEILARSCFHPVPYRHHDDPTKIQCALLLLRVLASSSQC